MGLPDGLQGLGLSVILRHSGLVRGLARQGLNRLARQVYAFGFNSRACQKGTHRLYITLLCGKSEAASMLTGLPHPGPLPNRCGGLQHAEEEAVNERLQDGEKPPFLRCARRSHSCDIRDFSVPPFPDLGDWQRPIRGGEVR